MLTVRIPPDLRAGIDAVRGDVPRERWIRRVLEAALSESDYIHVSHRHEPIKTMPREPDIQTGLAPPRPSGEMCQTCTRNGPPRTRPCAKCGYQAGR